MPVAREELIIIIIIIQKRHGGGSATFEGDVEWVKSCNGFP